MSENAIVWANWKTGEIKRPIPMPSTEWLAENLYVPLMNYLIENEKRQQPETDKE